MLTIFWNLITVLVEMQHDKYNFPTSDFSQFQCVDSDGIKKRKWNNFEKQYGRQVLVLLSVTYRRVKFKKWTCQRKFIF